MTAAAGGDAAAKCLGCDCVSADATRQLAFTLGQLAFCGLVIALTGDLGSGKTTFVQGLAEGLSVPPDCYVTSPSFNLINDYPGRLPLSHADLYRLGEAADLEAIGLIERMDGEGVVAIEWAEHAAPDLPRHYLAVHLEITGENCRQVILTAYGLQAGNLLKMLADHEPCHPIGT